MVLCSDGLSTQINRDKIAEIVNGEKELPQICKKLIDAANAAGGPDNITVIVARFEGEGLPEYNEDDEADESLVRHRPFPLDDSGATTMPIVTPHNDNETTQPIPVTARPSAEGAEGAGSTMGEAVPAVPPPTEEPRISGGIAKTIFTPMTAPARMQRTGSDGDEDDDDGEDQPVESSGTARLIMIFVGIMVILGGLWFAWTAYSKKG
jgi:hypothetical protein